MGKSFYKYDSGTRFRLDQTVRELLMKNMDKGAIIAELQTRGFKCPGSQEKIMPRYVAMSLLRVKKSHPEIERQAKPGNPVASKITQTVILEIVTHPDYSDAKKLKILQALCSD